MFPSSHSKSVILIRPVILYNTTRAHASRVAGRRPRRSEDESGHERLCIERDAGLTIPRDCDRLALGARRKALSRSRSLYEVLDEGRELGRDALSALLDEYASADVSSALDGIVEAKVDPADETCGIERRLATALLDFAPNGDVSGGRIVYCSLASARAMSTVVHELGHTFGLRHSPARTDLMYCTTDRTTSQFSPRESLLMNLMLQRLSRNRYPDDDRDVPFGIPLRVPHTERIICIG